MSGLFTIVARELTKYKLYLVGVLEVGWGKGGTVRAWDYIFFQWKRENIINWEQDFLYTTE